MDLAQTGLFYTWSNHQSENPILRKLDRVLVNDSWMRAFPQSYASFEPPGDSDHSPCILHILGVFEKRRVPFKYFTFIESHPSFLSSVQDSWSTMVESGTAMFQFVQWLKLTKGCCQELNRSGFNNIQGRAQGALDRLKSIQGVLMRNPQVHLFEDEQVAREEWNHLADAQESFFKQKSRIRWLKEGDANTSFFHKSVISRQSNNLICYLKDDQGNKISKVSDLKTLVGSYFQNHLGVVNQSVVPLSVEEIRVLHPFWCSESLAMRLQSIPSPEEIQKVVFNMPLHKAPGPDGFPVDFFRSTWHITGPPLVEAVRELFISGSLLKQVNATIICLIPKVKGADHLSQFRPISCCNTIYKVISRILAARLKLFIPQAVQENQVGFVKGRHLCENVLLASELVTDFHKDAPTSRGCLMLDISKAYDNMDWSFLLNVLEALDLPICFRSWIKECITSPSFSVALNGELVGYFAGAKGLRQGDPISSLLFVLGMDILAKQLDQGARTHIFGLHPKCEDPIVTHLSFADDVLIFFDGLEESLQGIMDILLRFATQSGLEINGQKSLLFLDGGNLEHVRTLASRFGLLVGALPVRYLGVPLSAHKFTKLDYQPLIDKIHQKFSSWTTRFLSFAGRLQLIRSVIYSTINFWCSIFMLPSKCLLDLERMCNAFLWSGAPNSARGAQIAWDTVCTPKRSGGLGLRSLGNWNMVFGLKLIWLLFASAGSLWVSWIWKNIVRNRNFWNLTPSYSGSWIWRRLCKLREIARPFLKCKLGDGRRAKFWDDDWTGFGPLVDLVGTHDPTLLGIPRTSSVAAAIRGEGWRLPTRLPAALILRECLPDQPPQLVPSQMDKFLWCIGDNKPSFFFSSAKTWEHLNPPGLELVWTKAVWFSGHIPKHAFICWVAARSRLLTRDRLRGWGMPISPLCLLCYETFETHHHLFFECSYSMELWTFFLRNIPDMPPTGLLLILEWLNSTPVDHHTTCILKLALQATVYTLWKERNARLHRMESRPASSLIRDITRTIRARLDPMSRSLHSTPSRTTHTSQETLMMTWFRRFQF